jgi:hypothetical protein
VYSGGYTTVHISILFVNPLEDIFDPIKLPATQTLFNLKAI